MPRGRVETMTPVSSGSQKSLGNKNDFTPIPTHTGTMKVLEGGFDPQLPPGRIIPFFSSFKVAKGEDHDFVNISGSYPVALLIS